MERKNENREQGLLKDRLAEVSVAPSAGVWEGIAAALPQKKKRRGFIWWWTGASAAAIALVFGFWPAAQVELQAEHLETSVPFSSIVTLQDLDHPVETSIHTATPKEEVYASSETTREHRTIEAQIDSKKAPVLARNNAPTTATEQQTVVSISPARINTTRASADFLDPQSVTLLVQPKLPQDIFPEPHTLASFDQPQDGQGQGDALFASAIGAASPSIGLPISAKNDMAEEKSIESADNSSNSGGQEYEEVDISDAIDADGSPALGYTPVLYNASEIDHRLPLSLQFLFEKSLNPKVSLFGGVQWDRHSSSRNFYSAADQVELQVKSTYLSVPLGFGFTFMQNERWALKGIQTVQWQLGLQNRYSYSQNYASTQDLAFASNKLPTQDRFFQFSTGFQVNRVIWQRLRIHLNTGVLISTPSKNPYNYYFDRRFAPQMQLGINYKF